MGMDRPSWCPHQECKFLVHYGFKMCCGQLRKPEPHDNDLNTHRFCLDTRETGHGIFDLQVNKGDSYWFKMLFETIETDAIETYPPRGHYIKK